MTISDKLIFAWAGYELYRSLTKKKEKTEKAETTIKGPLGGLSVSLRYAAIRQELARRGVSKRSYVQYIPQAQFDALRADVLSSLRRNYPDTAWDPGEISTELGAMNIRAQWMAEAATNLPTMVRSVVETYFIRPFSPPVTWNVRSYDTLVNNILTSLKRKYPSVRFSATNVRGVLTEYGVYRGAGRI